MTTWWRNASRVQQKKGKGLRQKTEQRRERGGREGEKPRKLEGEGGGKGASGIR
jgi:hypothetical protein